MGGEGEERGDEWVRVGGGFEFVGGCVIVVPGIWFADWAIKRQKVKERGSADVAQAGAFVRRVNFG